MRRPAVLLMLLVITFVFVWVAPVRGQDDFTPEEQAALDEIFAGLGTFMAAESYTVDVVQQMDQNIVVSYLGQEITLDQKMESEGSLQFLNTPDNEYDDRHLILNQNISTALSGTGTDNQQTIGPIQTQMIVIDDRIYLKMEVPLELQTMIPRGWYDVTDGAEGFPGMELFNLQGMLQVGNAFNAGYLDNLLKAVLTVEILESETVGDRSVNYYHLTLDPPLALQGIGAANMEGMFNAEQSPFDIAGFIDLLYTDEDTTYSVDFGIYADDQTLYYYAEQMTTDVDIPSSLITDPSLQGAEMTLVQEVLQTMQPHDFNVPVSIEAPTLGDSS